jgi:hypothetical protein
VSNNDKTDGAAIAARALEHIRHLSVTIGPRGSTTEGERRGAEYAAGVMGKWAKNVQTQPFRCYSTYSYPWALIALLMAASGLAIWVSPPAALILAGLNLPLYFAVASGRADVGFLFPKRPSQNVWGRVPAREGGRRVVLMAHVDTTRAALVYAPRALKHLRASHTLNMVSAVTLFALALIVFGLGGGAAVWSGLGLGSNWGGFLAYLLLGIRIVASVFALISVYALFTFAHRQLVMLYVAGANDNASGVGLTLAIGEHYAANPLPNTEIWCVVTGAEETGYPAGARKFVDAHLPELRESEVLVLDNIGAGDLRHLTKEGITLPLRMDKGLLHLARRLGSRHPDWRVRDSVCNLGYTDATPVIAAGCRAIVLWAEGADGFLQNYHWPTDTFENVDSETVGRAAIFITELIEAIDQGKDRG